MRKLLFLAVVVAFIALSPAHARCLEVDAGFRPERDGFGFANFGDPSQIAGLDLHALIGAGFRDEIFCHTGHCFGMATASVEGFEHGRASIGVLPADVMPYIDRVQTWQSFYYIADFFRPPFGNKEPDNVAEHARLLERLASGRPAVLGVYASRGGYPGHAVVAYRIELDGDRSLIYVYDPNLPATLHDYEADPLRATYDASDGTFRYDNGRSFDRMRLNDAGLRGAALGKTLSAGLPGLPGALPGLPRMLLLLLNGRPRPPPGP